MDYKLPADSLLASSWENAPVSVADVPEEVKAAIREEAVLNAFNHLENSLRLLMYATTPDREPPSADHCRKILETWRYELEHYVHLTPDTYCGAVRRYHPEVEHAYSVQGRCVDGDLLRIRVPCWRMRDRIVVRGQAELITGDDPAKDAVARSAGTNGGCFAHAMVEGNGAASAEE
jgi:hypothetical protein